MIIDHKKYLHKDRCIYASVQVVILNVRINASFSRIYALIFRKFFLVVKFLWGDIPIFLAVYDLELEILSLSKTQKNAIISGKFLR